MPAFDRYIGIDYSGAETPDQSLKGLRVYLADRAAPPAEVGPPPSPRKYWTRRGIAEWLVERLAEDPATLVGIAHGFSFPLRYFAAHRLEPDWPAFLDDFQTHWPTDHEHTYVDLVRHGHSGNGAARAGDSRWRRLTDERAGAKSLFQFDGPGSVAKATHAGLPWLRFLRQRLGERVHFWPFDGWLGRAGRTLGGAGSLSGPVEPQFRARGSRPASARRLRDRRLAARRRPRRQPRALSGARAHARRAGGRADRRLDSRCGGAGGGVRGEGLGRRFGRTKPIGALVGLLAERSQVEKFKD